MAKATDILQRWKSKGIHPHEDPTDVEKVLKLLEFDVRPGKGSHKYIVSHKKLKGLKYSEMSLSEEFAISLDSGRKIKKWQIEKLLKYIELLEAQNEC
jgi:hypothetical protein